MAFFPQATPSPTQSTPSSAPPGGQQLPPPVSNVPGASPRQAQQAGLPQQRKNTGPQSQRTLMQAPLSPEEEQRDSRRIDVLLEINRVLMQAVTQLQREGRTGPQKQGSVDSAAGGQVSPTTSEAGGKEAGEADKKKSAGSREYIECVNLWAELARNE